MTRKTLNANPYYCAADVHDDFGVDFHQCYHKPRKGSEWCGTHSPEAEDRREAKSDAYWKADQAKRLAPSRELDRLRAVHKKLLAALERLETVTRSYLRYVIDGEEPGCDAKDVRAYCVEAREAVKEAKK